MCRYAMSMYKSHYACFSCRKTFKRRLMWDINKSNKEISEAKCPQCAELMADMGLDFEAPKKNQIKEWNHIMTLYTVGIAFHSCGCTGPGYIPKDKENLINYFKNKLTECDKHLLFFRKRTEPSTESEIQRESSKFASYFNQIPHKLIPIKGSISNEDGINFWINKKITIEQKIQLASS
jgi:hypothetical protein